MAISKILVPLDGSHLAEAVLPYVRLAAEKEDTEIVLLQTVSPVHESGAMSLPVSEISQSATQFVSEAAQLYLNEVAKALRDEGFRATVVVGTGSPAEQITNYARGNNVDIIAMSTHGRTGLSRVIMGSVAGTVLRTAGRPILLVQSGQ